MDSVNQKNKKCWPKVLKLIVCFYRIKKKVLFFIFNSYFVLVRHIPQVFGQTMRQAPVAISTAWYPKNSNKCLGVYYAEEYIVFAFPFVCMFIRSFVTPSRTWNL